MRSVKLTIEYDGTDFAGWQVQPGARTVQEVLESALARIVGEPIRVIAAGRTDSGVHAAGQVTSFTTDRDLPLTAFVQGLNGELPRDVAVLAAEEVAPDFDARRSASGKVYRYDISNRPVRSPLHRRRTAEVFRPLDVAAMAEAAAHFVGEHDFSAMRAANCPARTTVRRVRRVEVAGVSGGDVSVTIEATAFLKHMVRNVVGTLIEVGHHKREPGSIPGLLASRDRTLAGPTAPGAGLTLVRVDYGPR